MGRGCWYSPDKGDLVSQRSTELKCLAAEIGQKEENGAWLLVLPPQGGLGFPEVHGAEVPGSGDRTKRKRMGRGCWYFPHKGDLVCQKSTELKCLAAEIGQKEENGAWLLVLPPQGGLGFPEVHGAEVPGSGDRTEGREWGMAAGTPPTRRTWFPRGPRS